MRARCVGMVLACVFVCGVAQAATTPDAPTRQQVQAAAEVVRADPDLPGTRTSKELRFKDRSKEGKPDKPEAKKKEENASAGWLVDFFRAVSEGGRVLVWVLGALLLAWVLVSLRHWVKVRADGARHAMEPLPSHVGALDIRPETLPADIGDAAAGLWQRGQQRAALSLLYRGALSRLVHVQAVPVRAASTEGECVALASRLLAPAPQAFFARLVDAWQQAAYGERMPATAGVLALCNEFDRQLPGAAPAGATR
ncbi:MULTISPECIES: DUF4129 domain-containing protein [unclassified Variovorax]|uniref:DUF4129 domain-containing protein n=1 Tax=unclassified Variovorax TaxID=663243 RepID=UPI002109135B|nr:MULTISPECIES: DUF4129 domain-containing protein [unclassified Variovorax]